MSRYEDSEGLITRRKFLRDSAVVAGVILTDPTQAIGDLITLSEQSHLRANESSRARLGYELFQEIENILGSHHASFELRLLRQGAVIDQISYGLENQIPTASAFKSAVLGWYLSTVSPDNWEIDKGDDAYNMIVYSHNSATGRILHQTAESARQDQTISGELSDIELFNNFLERLGLEGGWIASWGFNSPTTGQIDPRFTGRLLASGSSEYRIDNLVSIPDLVDFYQTVSDPHSDIWENNLEAYQAFRYLSGIIDPVFAVGMKNEFYGLNVLGKFGYLEPESLSRGSTVLDAGEIQLSEDVSIVLGAGTFNASESLINQVFEKVHGYVLEVSNSLNLDTENPPSIQPIESGRLKYFFPENQLVRGEGAIYPEPEQMVYLESIIARFNPHLHRPIGGLVTINLFDGTMATYTVDSGFPQLHSINQTLIGRRLAYGPEEDLVFNHPRFVGNYDRRQGVLSHRQEEREAYQHTMTFPMIGIYQGNTVSADFGGIPSNPATPFWAIKLIRNLGDTNRLELSRLNSEQTIHAIPQPVSEYSGREEFRRRSLVLDMVNHRLQTGLQIPRGFDPYWSSMCVNLQTDEYINSTRFAEGIRRRNEYMLVVMTYPLQSDWTKLIMPSGFESTDHLMYEDNIQRYR